MHVLASQLTLYPPAPAQYVADAQRGDPAAIRKLLEMLAPIVIATTRQILGQREDAEDAAQEALFDLARGIGSLRDPSAINAFARRITARVALRHRTKRTRDGERVRTLANEHHSEAQVEPSLGVSEQKAERLREHLARLPEVQAIAVVMQHMLGYRPAEIAEVTGVSVNTVRSRVRFGRLALSKSLAEDEAFDAPVRSEAS